MKYYIIVGEASGDLYGSRLITEIKSLDKNAKIRFWGGDKMILSGGTIVKHIRELAFMGFYEVIMNLYKIFSNISLCKRDIIEFNPDTEEEVWVYEADPPWAFYSPHISGAQRLWSGNTLICEGLWGRIFEINPEGEVVWEYISPHFGPCGPPEINNPAAIGNWVFRAYRYAPESSEINGRLP